MADESDTAAVILHPKLAEGAARRPGMTRNTIARIRLDLHMDTAEDRALRVLLIRPVRDVYESPIHCLAALEARGLVARWELPPHRRGSRVWHERVWTITERGMEEARRRGLSWPNMNPKRLAPTLAAVALLKGLGWSVTPPDGLRYGCHVELFALPEGIEPDGCVIDEGDRDSCAYARDIACKEQCRYWQAVTPESIRKARGE